MPTKKTTSTANVCANVYEGEFMLNFDCVGVTMCRFALCHVMPPDGSEDCVYREHGSCRLPYAKHAAIKSLMAKLTKELKQMEEEVSG